MPEVGAVAALLVAGTVLAVLAIRFGILLGGVVGRLDRDEEEDEEEPGGPGH
jgi:hypothetical protein